MIYGNVIGGAGQAKTYILQDEDGNEYPAVLVETKTVFDATANDIRLGKVAATDRGVTTGEKEIPAYHTTEGRKLVPAGGEFKITGLTHYAYTKLQVLICKYNTQLSNSVATEKVGIEDSVYAVGSTDVLSTITVEAAKKAINLGITNEGDAPRVIRYFTYREEL